VAEDFRASGRGARVDVTEEAMRIAFRNASSLSPY
jgi:hypothetical protein